MTGISPQKLNNSLTPSQLQQLHPSVQSSTEMNTQSTRKAMSNAKSIIGVKKNVPKMQLIVTDPETGAKSIQTYTGTTQLGSPVSVS